MHRLGTFVPNLLRKAFADGPATGSWSFFLSRGGGAIGVLRVLAVFQEFTRSIYGFSTHETLVLHVFRIFFVQRVLLLLGVLYCSYSQYLQYSGLQYCSYSQYSQCLGHQYRSTLSIRSTKRIRYWQYTREYSENICATF